jgi:hypothetical protein
MALAPQCAQQSMADQYAKDLQEPRDNPQSASSHLGNLDCHGVSPLTNTLSSRCQIIGSPLYHPTESLPRIVSSGETINSLLTY